jgi:hypothetical protein
MTDPITRARAGDGEASRNQASMQPEPQRIVLQLPQVNVPQIDGDVNRRAREDSWRGAISHWCAAHTHLRTRALYARYCPPNLRSR